jgi:hypothetical protein
VGDRLGTHVLPQWIPAKLGKLPQLLLKTERDQLLVEACGGVGQILQLRHATLL